MKLCAKMFSRYAVTNERTHGQTHTHRQVRIHKPQMKPIYQKPREGKMGKKQIEHLTVRGTIIKKSIHHKQGCHAGSIRQMLSIFEAAVISVVTLDSAFSNIAISKNNYD